LACINKTIRKNNWKANTSLQNIQGKQYIFDRETTQSMVAMFSLLENEERDLFSCKVVVCFRKRKG
jgi:hypothetical protein